MTVTKKERVSVMKKTARFSKTLMLLKVVMYFVAAIWGMVFGMIFPLTLLISYDPDIHESFLKSIAALWLGTAVAGYIIPCFLVKFKLYKIAAALSLSGAVAIFVVHSFFFANWQLYMPLLLETVAIVLIAILAFISEKKNRDDAPAPSILG